MGLLDLPPELFSLVTHHLVCTAGVAQAWPLRRVCRTFAAEIAYDVLAKQPKEVLIPISARAIMRKNLPTYLYNRIQAPSDVNTRLLERVKAMASYLHTELKIKNSVAKDRTLNKLSIFLAKNFYPDEEDSVFETLWGANFDKHLRSPPEQRTHLLQGELRIYDKISAAIAVDSVGLVRELLPQITDPLAQSISHGPLIDAVRTQNMPLVRVVLEYLDSLNLKLKSNRHSQIQWLLLMKSHFHLGTAITASIEYCDDEGEITYVLAQFHQEQLSFPNLTTYTSWLTKSCQLRRPAAMEVIAKMRRSKSWHSGPKSAVLKAACRTRDREYVDVVLDNLDLDMEHPSIVQNPLFIAVRWGSAECVAAVLERSTASLNIKLKSNLRTTHLRHRDISALDLAIHHEADEVVETLVYNGAPFPWPITRPRDPVVYDYMRKQLTKFDEDRKQGVSK
ncbi:hypothetical protein FB567DRAFT_551333 [Paraphoma chrysanthemicola]|uniref:Uncharacterized protein n=1 Tax=Paraphoma chrysanthemicola TaxID=798071 RepID=A0A8K0VVX9_9PLEO|nr:hypothetical protein FB567DRAFT_551333 [Paraphoma chrysanthemicola]